MLILAPLLPDTIVHHLSLCKCSKECNMPAAEKITALNVCLEVQLMQYWYRIKNKKTLKKKNKSLA